MDPLSVVSLARSLVDIDSTTGREREVGEWLSAWLSARGWHVTRQAVGPERFNVYAALLERPRVVFSTHLDCVPPFLPARVDDGLLRGRGACDAKGILAAQVVAAERLRERGATDVGLLFVVGEERGSDGARVANGLSPGPAWLVNGEPTENRMAIATRGVYRARLIAKGRAAHSSHPETGESAIDKLIDALLRLRAVRLPEDPSLGRTHYTVGLISGGVAPNVVPAQAEAEVLFRTIGDPDALRDVLAGLAPLVTPEEVLHVPPVRMTTLGGFDTAAFSYTTDVPFLSAWGRPVLYGPGSILVAHGDDEHVAIAALHRAVEDYVRIAGELRRRPAGSGNVTPEGS